MNSEFLTVLVFCDRGAFVFGSLAAGWFIRPSAQREGHHLQCSERPFSSAWFSFNPRFYIIALIFIVFDVALAILFAPLTWSRRWSASGHRRSRGDLSSWRRSRSGSPSGARRHRVDKVKAPEAVKAGYEGRDS